MLALFYYLSTLPSSGATESNQDTSKKVVVVHAANFLLPARTVADQTMRQGLIAGARDTIAFETEALQVSDQKGVAPQQELDDLDRLKSKYASEQVDLVVVAGGDALEFVERHRDEIWPDRPVIYYGVSDRRTEGRTFAPDIGGLTVHFDVSGTLSLAMRMQSKADHVVHISGAAPYDRTFEQIFAEAMEPHRDRFRVTTLSGLSPAELKHELSRLPPESIVLYTSMLMDENGKTYPSVDLLDSLIESSAAPVYSLFSSYLNHGTVGGSMIDFEDHGRRAGLLAARVLNGDVDSPEAPLPHIVSPSTCTLDVQRMKHWNLAARLAPADCKLLFGPQPFWQAHRAIILLIAGTAILLTSMAVALRAQERKRRTAEQEAMQRRQEAIHATRLALVGEISASIVHEVTQPLSAILSNADAAEMLLDRENPSIAEIRAILADIRRDDSRAHEIVSRLRLLLKQGKLHIANIDPNELTTSTLTLVRAEARHRHVVVNNAPDPTLPAIAGDPVHLQQVLLNLLVNALNALEAVPPNQRMLELRTSRQGANAVCITVRDSGPGIAPEILPRIFESFSTTKPEGMGLGLSIAKAIVDAHGGSLTAVSTASQGAEFRLTLPVAPQTLLAD